MQICFLLKKISDLYLVKIQICFCFKKMFWCLIADFEIKEELKLVNQLRNMSKKIPTMHINMANMNYEQDHN